MSSIKEHVVVLSGAGISAESGLKTFRGDDGLWEGHRVEDVATPEAWQRDPELVLEFYNQRRCQGLAAKPNPAHQALARLEQAYDVDIITQNIDNLHERAGSTRVLHLHGEIMLARSSIDESLLVPLDGGRDIKIGDQCPLGSQLRPHVVWFGEAVPALEPAEDIVSQADILIVIGTSLVVYPAALLAFRSPQARRRVVINPEIPESIPLESFECISESASQATPRLVDELLAAAT